MKKLNTVDFSIDKWRFQNRLKTGSRVDIGRYLEGRHDCWGGVRRSAKAKRTVRVYVQYGGNCERTKEELSISGAVAATIVNILESMGVDTELWVVLCAIMVDDKCSLDLCSCVKIKSSSEFSDLGAINFFAGYEYMFRGVGFLDIVTSVDEMDKDVAYCLGKHEPVSAQNIGLDDYEAEHSIIIPAMYTIDKAKNYLQDLINNKVKEIIK
jgi:hypothetical protein